MSEEKESYNVAFRYTREMGGYHGVITWTPFPSKEYFDEWYTPDLRKQQEVVEEGISEERAIQLAESTPDACNIAAALQDATMPNGKINQSILETKLATIAYVKAIDG